MKPQAPVALVLLVLLATAGHVKGDFFGNLLTSMAKQLFNPNGPTVSSAPVEGGPTDVGKVPHGNILEEAFQSELDAAVQHAEAMEANKTGTPAGEITPDYKDVEEVLEEQLEEEVVDLEQAVVEQKMGWDEDGVVAGAKVVNEDAMLEELEVEDYALVEERVEDVEELVDEFDAAQQMADKIAMNLGKDVTVTMQDSDGNSYEVSSNLAAAMKATKSLADLDTQVDQEAADIAKELEGGDGVIDAGTDPMPNDLFERALEDEEAEEYAETVNEEAGQYTEEAEKYAEEVVAAERSILGPLENALGTLDGAEPQQPEPVQQAVHGLEGGEVVQAPDTTIAEGEAEGREAEANVIVTETDLFHMEATEQHSSRVHFVVSAILPAASSNYWPDHDAGMEFNLTSSIIRDIELAAGYYYDQNDVWEPGFGVYFNQTMSRYYTSGYDAIYEAEIIYPVSYNQEDIERFVQRLIRAPGGMFEITRKYHPMIGVSVSQKVEYCSNDWTFWSFTTASGDWALEQHAEGQREAHQCWYNARTRDAPVQWGMEDMWMLIGAMLVSGGMAATVGAISVHYCCKTRSGEEEDELPRHHRRYLIESRLKGKGGNPLSALRRKSERMWRRNQYMPHADPCDVVNMEVNPAEPDPLGSRSKLQELAESYSAPTWHPHNIDLDEKYGKKFSKQTKFTWVGDYKTQYARRARAKATALAKEVADKEKETAKAGCSSESDSPDIPTSFDAGDSPVEMYGNTITKRAAAGKSSW